LPQRLDRTALKTEVVQIFNAAIKSPVTRDVYERRLLNFLTRMKMTPEELVSIAKNDPLATEKKIISFALELKSRHEKGEIAAGTVHNCVKCVRLLLEMNDIFLNWKKISRILPKVRRYALDRIPTIDEIKEMIDSSDLRGKALTLVLLSSGIREGAIERLRVGDYSIISSDGQTKAGKLVVYAGEVEQYTAFIMPEACTILEKYLDFRRQHGEIVSGTSPLFCDAFDPIAVTAKPSVRIVKRMSAHAIRQYYNRLLHSIGLRNGKKRRHEFSVHGFRKYFKTKAEQSGMQPINIEILMGHSVGISDSYYRPTESQLALDYTNKAVHELTVSGENLLQKQVDKLKQETKDNEYIITGKLQKKENEIEQLRQNDKVKEDALATLSDQVMKLMVEVQELKKERNIERIKA
jgi:integrase